MYGTVHKEDEDMRKFLFGFLLAALSFEVSAQTLLSEQFRLEDVTRQPPLTGPTIADVQIVLQLKDLQLDSNRYRLDSTSYATLKEADLCRTYQQWVITTPLNQCPGLTRRVRPAVRLLYKF